MIITVSREFGSGGRELGKRLSDALRIPCYDNEIISMIANHQGFDEHYVSRMSEKSIQEAYPITGVPCRCCDRGRDQAFLPVSACLERLEFHAPL